MKQVLIVFIGGGIGSVARYLLGKWLNNLETTIPYGTLLSNVLGSLLMGLVIGYLSKNSNISETHTLLLVTGFCGGFTTFSAFAYENHLFLKNGDYVSFLSYSLGSLILSFLAIFSGLYLAKVI